MLEIFAEAEATFGTTSLEETIQREEENMELALERRAAPTTPQYHLHRTQQLNNNSTSLTVCHASGHLTKEQFNELNLRRKKLANLLGAINSGKIRHIEPTVEICPLHPSRHQQ